MTMAVQMQVGAPTDTAMVVKEAFAKQRTETMTTDASSGYASDDSIDLDYEKMPSAPIRKASDSTFSAENLQEISQASDETSVPASVGPKASVGLTIPGMTNGHARSICMIDLPKKHKDVQTNMQIATALTPVGSPTSSGRRTDAWRRQRAGRAKDASEPVRELLRIASRRLFQSVPVPQKSECVGTNDGSRRWQTPVPSLRPTSKTCVAA
jgi:hypothetical protein